MIKYILAVALTVVPLRALSAEEEAFTTYSNAHHGFSIAYPKAWKFNDGLAIGGSGVLTLDVNGNSWISFSAWGIPKGVDLQSFERNILGRPTNISPIIDLTKGTPVKLGSFAARRHEYTQTWTNPPTKGCYVTAVTGERGYLLNLTASAEDFSKYEAAFNKLLFSFKTFAPDNKNSQLRHQELGFVIEYPVTWKVETRIGTATIRPLIETADEMTKASIILGWNSREDITVESFAKEMLKDMRKEPGNTTGGKFSDLSEVTIGKRNALRFGFSNDTDRADCYFISGNKCIIYIIASGPVATWAMLDGIVNSFTVDAVSNSKALPTR